MRIGLLSTVALTATLGIAGPDSRFAQLRDEDEEQDVIVVYDEDDEDADDRRGRELRDLGAKGHRRHGRLHMDTMRANRQVIERLKRDKKVRYVAPDRQISASSNNQVTHMSLRSITGLSTSQAGTYTGRGVGVAILDSGIYSGAYFRDANANCKPSRIVYSENFTQDRGTDDRFGHGTHVASILANNASCDSSKLEVNGVAPDANLINLRVLDSKGKGKDSGVIAALDRAVQLKKAYNIRVINLSLGRTIRESFQVDPLCQAVERAWKAGIVVVVAAGNNGRDNSMNTNGYATIA